MAEQSITQPTTTERLQEVADYGRRATILSAKLALRAERQAAVLTYRSLGGLANSGLSLARRPWQRMHRPNDADRLKELDVPERQQVTAHALVRHLSEGELQAADSLSANLLFEIAHEADDGHMLPGEPQLDRDGCVERFQAIVGVVAEDSDVASRRVWAITNMQRSTWVLDTNFGRESGVRQPQLTS